MDPDSGSIEIGQWVYSPSLSGARIQWLGCASGWLVAGFLVAESVGRRWLSCFGCAGRRPAYWVWRRFCYWVSRSVEDVGPSEV